MSNVYTLNFSSIRYFSAICFYKGLCNLHTADIYLFRSKKIDNFNLVQSICFSAYHSLADSWVEREGGGGRGEDWTCTVGWWW